MLGSNWLKFLGATTKKGARKLDNLGQSSKFYLTQLSKVESVLMKGMFVKTLLVASLITSVTAQADSREACEAYRQEIIQLRAALDQKYGERRVLLRDMSADPAARSALIARYTVDPDNIRFRELMDKFRADRTNECGWWTSADGAFN